jgi:hypothetical protein
MTHLISIDLLPNIGTVVDLGTTPCAWHIDVTDQRNEGCLEFLDAPYGFYDYIDEVLGSESSNDFADMFFTILNQEIQRLGGISDDMQFTLVMPKFFHLTFNINIFEDNE